MSRNADLEFDDAPHHQKKAPKKKPFGIEYFRMLFGCWYGRCDWYATEKSRDQAFNNLVEKAERSPFSIGSKIRKVHR
jgi:hypothetical protein